MKVFVVPGKNPLTDPGGYASYGFVLGECLSQLGYDVELLCLGPDDGEIQTAAGRLRTFASRTIPRRTELFPYWCRKFAWEIRNVLGSAEPAIVHGIGPWSLAGVIAKRRNSRIKAVGSYFTTLRNETFWLAKGITVRDYGFRPKVLYLAAYSLVLGILNPIERFAVSRLDELFVHYDYSRKMLRNEMGLAAQRIIIIPYGIDLQPKALSKVVAHHSGEKFEVLTVCRQEPRKGINYLLRAYRILSERGIDFHATVVGSGAFLQANRDLCQRLGVAGRVDFPGFAPNLSEYLGSANAFVLPSLQEGGGSISLLEAMSYGIPVVVAACDGLLEDISDGVNGLLAPPADEKGMADAIESLYKDELLRSRLANAAKAFYLSRFQPSAMREALRPHYQRLGFDLGD